MHLFIFGFMFIDYAEIVCESGQGEQVVFHFVEKSLYQKVDQMVAMVERVDPLFS